MGIKLTDEQREQRRKEKVAKLFAGYKRTGTEKRGDPDSWERAAKSSLANGNLSEDLNLLGIEKPPNDLEELKVIYRAKMMEVHPDRGGTTELAAKVNGAYLRLKALL